MKGNYENHSNHQKRHREVIVHRQLIQRQSGNSLKHRDRSPRTPFRQVKREKP
jgi:hypothetical protein